MKFINFIIVRLSICLALGISSAHYITLQFRYILFCFGLVLVSLFLVWVTERRRLLQGWFFGLLVYLTFFFMGMLNYSLQMPDLRSSYYGNFVGENKTAVLVVKIKEVLRPSSYYDKYFAQVQQIDEQHTSGLVLLQIKKEEGSTTLFVDEQLKLVATIQELKAPLNPYQFDYKSYLNRQGVGYETRATGDQVILRAKGSSSLKGIAEHIRGHIINRLANSNIDSDERAIIQALILGQRNDISKELRANYAAAGALHILAVSGLHVGILFILFSGVFSFLRYFPWGKIIIALVVVLLLWSFAILAGLSPSVVRAVTMFSFFSFASMFQRPTNSYNTLFLSFFVLLLWNPNWLFHVGFQLSYLAVLGILWIQPMLYSWYRPRFYLDRLFWSITTVTVAAQLGILPLSLFYFHQFPGLFFITNLVILPFLTILLGIGLLVVVFAVTYSVPEPLAIFYNFLIKLLNDFIRWVARQEEFVINNISLSIAEVIALYIFIYFTISFLKHPKLSGVVRLIASILPFILVQIETEHRLKMGELVIFNRYKESLMAYSRERELLIFNDDSSAVQNKFPLKDYCIAKRVVSFSSEAIPQVFNYRGKRVLRLDSLPVYPREKMDILWLTYSPKVHLERLLEHTQPQLVIADGSNYNSFIDRWKKTCIKRKIPLHDTSEEGAFIWKELSVTRMSL